MFDVLYILYLVCEGEWKSFMHLMYKKKEKERESNNIIALASLWVEYLANTLNPLLEYFLVEEVAAGVIQYNKDTANKIVYKGCWVVSVYAGVNGKIDTTIRLNNAFNSVIQKLDLHKRTELCNWVFWFVNKSCY